jgi:hypothetical protein
MGLEPPGHEEQQQEEHQQEQQQQVTFAVCICACLCLSMVLYSREQPHRRRWCAGLGVLVLLARHGAGATKT